MLVRSSLGRSSIVARSNGLIVLLLVSEVVSVDAVVASIMGCMLRLCDDGSADAITDVCC